jgi:hypothetical protein
LRILKNLPEAVDHVTRAQGDGGVRLMAFGKKGEGGCEDEGGDSS